MNFLKYIQTTFLLIFIRLCIFAQPVVDFKPLEQALQNNLRNDVVIEFNRLCEQASAADFRNETFEKLLDISHQLSRRGYSEIVYLNLEKLSGENEIFTKFSKKFFSRFYNELGYAYYHNQKLEKADSVFQLNLKLKEIFPEVSNLDIAYSLNYLGLLQRRLRNYEQAIEFLEKAKNIRIAELGENHQQVGAIYNNIGLVFNTSGDYENALLNFKQAIRIKQLSGNETVYNNYFNLGVLSGVLGNYSEALDNYKKAEELLLDSDNQEILADVYMNTGGILNNLKANREAFQYYQKALQIYTEYLGDEHKKTADVYQNLSSVYDELGDFEKSIQSFRKALEINENLYGQSNIELAPLFNNYGLVLQKRGNYRESLVFLQRAKAIYTVNETEPSEKYNNTLINIGETYRLLGLSDSARYFYQYAIENLKIRFGGKHPLLAHANNQIATIFFAEGGIHRANTFVQQALTSNITESSDNVTTGESCLNPSYLFNSYLILGKIESAINGEDITRAIKCFHLADSILSVQRNFLFNKDDKINLAQNSKRLTEAVFEVLSGKKQLNVQELDLAFRFLEKSKNLVLLQSINENSRKSFTGIPSSVLQKEEEILGRINYLEHQINVTTDSLTTLRLESRLFDQKLMYKKLVEELEKKYPRYFERNYGDHLPEISHIQHFIKQETILISYFVTEKSVFRFTIQRDNIELDKFQTPELDDLLVGMRKGITLKLDDVYLEKAPILGKILIPGNIPEKVKNIVIIPDGGLSVLPFEALLLEKPAATSSPNNWEFFGKKYRIKYAPSVAIWENLNKNSVSKSDTKSILAFAPVFERLKVSPKAGNTGNPVFLNLLYNSRINSLGVAPLTETKSEVLGIDTLFTSRNYKSDVFLFSEASERNLKQLKLEKYSFIHIATHGFVDKNNPELSGLIFAPVNNESFDNVLYTDEIYNLKLNAELVTLSACETGLGRVAEGEGLLGFARAFFYSGAKNLLVSLWKVNDHSTSVLMTRMYSDLLAKEQNLSEALYHAKKQYMDDRYYSHPYYWAPFVLIGG